MKKARSTAGFAGVSAAVCALLAGTAFAVLDSGQAFAAVAGVGIAWSSTLAGFLILLVNVDATGNRFLGAFSAGVLLRLAALGLAAGFAGFSVMPAQPLLVAIGLTFFILLAAEGAFFYRVQGS